MAFENYLLQVCVESDVEWLSQKPRWVGEREMCSVMLCRTNFSSILKGLDSGDIGP